MSASTFFNADYVYSYTSIRETDSVRFAVLSFDCDSETQKT